MWGGEMPLPPEREQPLPLKTSNFSLEMAYFGAGSCER